LCTSMSILYHAHQFCKWSAVFEKSLQYNEVPISLHV
jgi:hypothetical protein